MAEGPGILAERPGRLCLRSGLPRCADRGRVASAQMSGLSILGTITGPVRDRPDESSQESWGWRLPRLKPSTSEEVDVHGAGGNARTIILISRGLNKLK
jgi:hypothetical protein